MKQVVCEICGESFNMGHNGSVYGCDVCAGVIRDKDGEMSIPYNLINLQLPNGVSIVPDNSGVIDEYVLVFDGDDLDYDSDIVKLAKSVVAKYDTTNWADAWR